MRNASGDNSVKELSVAMVPMKFNRLLWAAVSLVNKVVTEDRKCIVTGRVRSCTQSRYICHASRLFPAGTSTAFTAFTSDTVVHSNRLNFIGTMATETSSTLLSPEAFLKMYIPPSCPSVNSPIVSLRPKSDLPDSQQLCLWKWPARHTQGHDMLDRLFRRYRYHTIPDDSPSIRM